MTLICTRTLSVAAPTVAPASAKRRYKTVARAAYNRTVETPAPPAVDVLRGSNVAVFREPGGRRRTCAHRVARTASTRVLLP